MEHHATADCPWWHLDTGPDGDRVLRLAGAWRLEHLEEIDRRIAGVPASDRQPDAPLRVDGAGLTGMYASGAALMHRLVAVLGTDPTRTARINFSPAHEAIARLVAEHLPAAGPESGGRPALGFIAETGRRTLAGFRPLADMTAFIGATTLAAAHLLRRPGDIRVKELTVQIQRGLLEAMPIITMVTMLIGVVVAYLFAGQIQRYGANIFIVDGVGIAMCRELSPMIVAIVVAGRTGSAYTAQIGTMKLNEEIDALITLGLSPMQVLVIPRVLALVIAMPLLVFIGDLVGILGGLIIARLHLAITPATFLGRLQEVVTLQHFFIGIAKAPIFAAFIAMIGCRMGLAAETDARSIGLNTTSTVVQSIVSVILLDAAFAIICVELGI
ncbi:MAG: ABC transporter permease [Deltaproteobacteria bacterium]|nr:ABC transporter permease [Candidatus Anaeroferrophillacea bacterium]